MVALIVYWFLIAFPICHI